MPTGKAHDPRVPTSLAFSRMAQDLLLVGLARDRPFDQREIVHVGGLGHRFLEVGELHELQQVHQFVFAIQDLQLTACARSEFEHRYPRTLQSLQGFDHRLGHHSIASSSRLSSA